MIPYIGGAALAKIRGGITESSENIEVLKLQQQVGTEQNDVMGLSDELYINIIELPSGSYDLSIIATPVRRFHRHCLMWTVPPASDIAD